MMMWQPVLKVLTLTQASYYLMLKPKHQQSHCDQCVVTSSWSCSLTKTRKNFVPQWGNCVVCPVQDLNESTVSKSEPWRLPDVGRDVSSTINSARVQDVVLLMAEAWIDAPFTRARSPLTHSHNIRVIWECLQVAKGEVLVDYSGRIAFINCIEEINWEEKNPNHISRFNFSALPKNLFA